MRLDARLPDTTAKPGLVNHFSLSRCRIFLADPKTLEHRIANLQVDGLDLYCLGAVQVAMATGDGVDRLIRGAVTLDDPLQGGGPELS